MERNVGSLDGTARIGIGVLVLIAGGLAMSGYWTAGTVVGGLALLIGAILLVTGTTKKCPIYALAGFDTVEKQ